MDAYAYMAETGLSEDEILAEVLKISEEMYKTEKSAKILEDRVIIEQQNREYEMSVADDFAKMSVAKKLFDDEKKCDLIAEDVIEDVPKTREDLRTARLKHFLKA